MRSDPTYTRPDDELAAALGDFIQSLQANVRLYPDLYADRLADVARAYFEK